jgi:hypothetical protein
MAVSFGELKRDVDTWTMGFYSAFTENVVM